MWYLRTRILNQIRRRLFQFSRTWTQSDLSSGHDERGISIVVLSTSYGSTVDSHSYRVRTGTRIAHDETARESCTKTYSFPREYTMCSGGTDYSHYLCQRYILLAYQHSTTPLNVTSVPGGPEAGLSVKKLVVDPTTNAAEAMSPALPVAVTVYPCLRYPSQ